MWQGAPAAPHNWQARAAWGGGVAAAATRTAAAAGGGGVLPGVWAAVPATRFKNFRQ
jgi:hypothetical protein